MSLKHQIYWNDFEVHGHIFIKLFLYRALGIAATTKLQQTIMWIFTVDQ